MERRSFQSFVEVKHPALEWMIDLFTKIEFDKRNIKKNTRNHNQPLSYFLRKSRAEVSPQPRRFHPIKCPKNPRNILCFLLFLNQSRIPCFGAKADTRHSAGKDDTSGMGIAATTRVIPLIPVVGFVDARDNQVRLAHTCTLRPQYSIS